MKHDISGLVFMVVWFGLMILVGLLTILCARFWRKD